LERFKLSQPQIKAATEDALKEIKAANGKVQNVLLSGHDGGGMYGGSGSGITDY
jgi:hypothetical protein